MGPNGGDEKKGKGPIFAGLNYVQDRQASPSQ
jgi:hypothetical protein